MENFINLDAIRRTPQYLNLLRFGLLADLDELGIESVFSEIPQTSFQDIVDYVKSKGWDKKINLNKLISDTDKFYQEQESGPDKSVDMFKKFVAEGHMTQEALDEIIRRKKSN